MFRHTYLLFKKITKEIYIFLNERMLSGFLPKINFILLYYTIITMFSFHMTSFCLYPQVILVCRRKNREIWFWKKKKKNFKILFHQFLLLLSTVIPLNVNFIKNQQLYQSYSRLVRLQLKHFFIGTHNSFLFEIQNYIFCNVISRTNRYVDFIN